MVQNVPDYFPDGCVKVKVASLIIGSTRRAGGVPLGSRPESNGMTGSFIKTFTVSTYN
jgi:hypothetical protein